MELATLMHVPMYNQSPQILLLESPWFLYAEWDSFIYILLYRKGTCNNLKRMSYCLYSTSSGQVYAAVSFINWIVPLVISLSSFVKDQRTGRVGKQFTFFAFGWYLFVCQFILYILQTALHVQRPDPFCPSMMTDGFPSSAAFHVAVVGITVLCISWILEFSFSWITYPFLLAWWIAPSFVLVWFQFNVWQEVVISLCMGVLVTLLYFVTIKYYLIQLLPYILNQAPWSYFYCLDTWLQDEKGQEKTEHLRVMLERNS